MSYSHHFIIKVLKLKAEGFSYKFLSDKFDIAVRSIQNWKQGNLPTGSRNKSNLKLDIEKLKIDIQLHNDSYQYERAERLGVCKSSIGYNLKKLNITYKKNSNTSKSRRREAKIIQRKNQEA